MAYNKFNKIENLLNLLYCNNTRNTSGMYLESWWLNASFDMVPYFASACLLHRDGHLGDTSHDEVFGFIQ